MRALLVGAVVAAGCGRVGFDDATRDAPTGTDDGAADARVPLCDRYPGALYCNDFDTPDLFGAQRLGGATYEATGGRDGTGAHAMSAAPGALPRIQVPLSPTLFDGALHIAGEMLVEPGPGPEVFVVFAQALSPTFVKISYDGVSADRAQLTNFVVGSAGAQAAPGSLPRGAWFCFELAIAIAGDGGAGAVALSIDDALVMEQFQGQATQPTDGFFRVEIGAIASASNTSTIAVRYDSLIVARGPIGCP